MSVNDDFSLEADEIEQQRRIEEERRRKNRERVRRWRERKRAESKAQVPPEDKWALLSPENRDIIRRYLDFRAMGTTANARKALLRASREAYEHDLVTFALFLNGRPLLRATRDDVAAWLEANTRDPKDPIDGRPWTRRTAHRKRSALNGFFEWALEDGLIDRSPMQRIKPPKFKKPEPVWLPKSEVDRIFEHIETKIAVSEPKQAVLYMLDAALFRMLFHWGLRVSEATLLTYEQIRKEGDELRAIVYRKGDKMDVFPITGVVRQAFDRWHHVRAEIHADSRHIPYVFVHPHFRKRVSRKRAWLRLRKIAHEAGLPPHLIRKLSPHKLRHSVARHMLESGIPINQVKAFLSHADIRTTQEYLDLDERARIAIVRRMSMEE